MMCRSLRLNFNQAEALLSHLSVNAINRVTLLHFLLFCRVLHFYCYSQFQSDKCRSVYIKIYFLINRQRRLFLFNIDLFLKKRHFCIKFVLCNEGSLKRFSSKFSFFFLEIEMEKGPVLLCSVSICSVPLC